MTHLAKIVRTKQNKITTTVKQNAKSPVWRGNSVENEEETTFGFGSQKVHGKINKNWVTLDWVTDCLFLDLLYT